MGSCPFSYLLIADWESTQSPAHPSPRFVKAGARYRHQTHEQQSAVDAVDCRPHPAEGPELLVETLHGIRVDLPSGHQCRSQIRGVAGDPRPGDVLCVWLDLVALQVLQR